MKNNQEFEKDNIAIFTNMHTFRRFTSDVYDIFKDIVRDIERDINALNLFIHELHLRAK